MQTHHPATVARITLALFVVLAVSAGCSDEGGSTTTVDVTAGDTGASDSTAQPDTSTDNDSTIIVADTGAPPSDMAADAPSDGPADSAADSAADTALTDMDHGDLVGLTVSPPSVTLQVVDGAITPTTFTAMAVFADGFTQSVNPSWSFERFDLATIDQSGTLTPTGTLGGIGDVVAQLGALEGRATVTVVLQNTVNTAALDGATMAAFDAPDATPSGNLLYPYDQTVFARGILAPELMWEGGASGDLYRVRISQDFLDLTYFISADPPSAFKLEEPIWTLLTESNAGEPVSVQITRMTAGGSAHAPMTQQWHIAQGSLRGTIYYWAVNQGRLMKISPGASAPSTVFDSGPATEIGSPVPAGYVDDGDPNTTPWTTGSGGNRCVSCHTVSRNGNAIAAVFENNGTAPSPWGLVDLANEPPSLLTISSYDDNTIFLALSPAARWTVSNKASFAMTLTDNTLAQVVPSALDLFTDNTADPQFSPGGNHLAFASNVVGSYPVEYTAADLDVMDFDVQTGELTNRRRVLAGNGEAIAFPSFTPDNQWITYQKGDYSRAKYGTDSVGHNNLFMVDVAGVEGEIRLDNLNGEAYLPAHNHNLNYEPRVNPIAVGGYSWVVFFSPRDYGHRMQSSGGNPTYENRKQLWVAALDLSPQAGQDPSNPAFWLPGQDLSTVNMSAYWTLDPCAAEGEGCEAGFECCSGFCQPDANGVKVCVPPTGQCSAEGDACQSGSDCCGNGDLICLSGFCSLIN